MHLIVVLLLALTAPAAASAFQLEDQEAVTETAGGGVVHNASGFCYPIRLADMPRRKVQVYAADNVGVQYTLRGGGNGDAWLDLFVYPAKLTLDQEATAVEASLVNNLGGKVIRAPSSLPRGAADGRTWWVKGSLQQIPLTSGYMLVQRGGWNLKVRATIPDAAGAEGWDRLRKGLEAIDWTWRPGATPPVSGSKVSASDCTAGT